jgi:SPP1 family predicted phage head-tail adaptor
MLLDKTCTIKRYGSPTKTAFGGTERGTATTVATNVRCRRHQVSGQKLSTAGDGVQSFLGTHRLWLYYGTDVTKNDVVEMGGVEYEVVDINPDLGGRGQYMALGLEVVT